MFRHLHIVACSPRTGTTLLHEVMVTCFKVDKHYDHEIRFHLVTGNDGELVITKRPKDTMYMPAVLDDDPQLYVIYLLRDPRDTICSRHGKDKSIYYSNIRLWRQMHGYARQMQGHERFLEVRYEEFRQRSRCDAAGHHGTGFRGSRRRTRSPSITSTLKYPKNPRPQCTVCGQSHQPAWGSGKRTRGASKRSK